MQNLSSNIAELCENQQCRDLKKKYKDVAKLNLARILLVREC